MKPRLARTGSPRYQLDRLAQIYPFFRYTSFWHYFAPALVGTHRSKVVARVFGSTLISSKEFP
jgi:hypothetical protein